MLYVAGIITVIGGITSAFVITDLVKSAKKTDIKIKAVKRSNKLNDNAA